MFFYPIESYPKQSKISNNMVDKIYIPTYGRVGKQITFNALPEKWKKKTVLVIHEKEKDLHQGYPVLICPEQGKGIAPVRKWIAEYADMTRYAVLDDDICFMKTKQKDEVAVNNRKLRPEEFEELIIKINQAMDEGFIHVACEVTWNPPIFDKDFLINTRITNNIFYDGTKLPWEHLDWTSLSFAEDYYINLQLLTLGFRNKVFLRYRTTTMSVTQAPGGCSSFRNIENHNESMRKLKHFFPEFVTLKEKICKVGPWKGLPKLAATIYWKKAYLSSLKS